MDKLICELETTLRVIDDNPYIKARALKALVNREVIVTFQEVKSYTDSLCRQGFISISKNGSFTATQAGVNLLGKCKQIKPHPIETKNRPNNPNPKENEMKGLNPKLKQSLAALREKLETKPLQEIKDFDVKVELLNEIKTLPGVDGALSGMLTDIAKDLSNIQVAATK